MNRRTLVMALAVMVAGFATVSTAEAGGGGGKTKPNAIYIVNAQAGAPNPAQLVIWLPTASTLPVTGTYDELYAAGAKYIAPGQTLKMFPNVAPGSGNVWVFPFQGLAPGAAIPFASHSKPYTVKSGTTLGYTISGLDGLTTVITPIQ